MKGISLASSASASDNAGRTFARPTVLTSQERIMSLLDKLTGIFSGGKDAEGAQSGHLSGLFGDLLGNDSAGLKSLVEKFNAAGLQETITSWIGKGKNLPISADQIKSALGSEQMMKLAQKIGLPTDTVANLLAKHLPNTVDQLTPDGTIPEEA
jgi:uncharacterized protein YidB (DUF937 family)